MKLETKKTRSNNSERLAAALLRLHAAQEQARVELNEVTRLTALLNIASDRDSSPDSLIIASKIPSSNSARHRTTNQRRRNETLLDNDLRIGDRVKVNNPGKLQPKVGTVIGCDTTFLHVQGDRHVVPVKRIAANLTTLK